MKKAIASCGLAVWIGVLLLSMPGVAQVSGSDYQIGPKDLLEIKVQEVPELNVERRVLDDGSIDLPLVGLVPVAGSSAQEVRDRLASLLMAKYVNQAYVTVTVKEYANKPIMLLGGVSRPGPLTVSGRWTLQQAILNAGGLTPNAGKKIFILRTTENGLTDRIEVNADELFVRANPVWNVPVQPGDIITVSVRQPVTIFCLGEFKTPGAIQFDSEDKITLLTLVAKTGGFSDRASKGSIRIKRTGPDGKSVEIPVNYNRIVAGKDPDVTLQANDVVIVKESLF